MNNNNLFNDFVGPEFRGGIDMATVPDIKLSELSPDAKVADAIYAYCKSTIVTGYLGRGSLRAADVYIYLAKELGNITIKEAETRRFAATMRDEKWGRFAAGTVNNKMSKLSNVFGWLYDYDIATQNPWKEIRRAKESSRNKIHKKKAQRVNMNDDEVKVFLEYLDNVCPRTARRGTYGALFRIALFTSLRYSEVLNIRAEWIDKEKSVLYLPAEVAKTDDARPVFLTNACMALLEEFWPEDGSGKFFTVGYNSWYTLVHNYNKKNNTNFHMHIARHDRISKFARNSGSILKTKSVSGHKSIQALQHYLHEDSDEDRVEILRIMNQIDDESGARAGRTA